MAAFGSADDFDPLDAPLPAGDTVPAQPLRAVIGETFHRIRTSTGLRGEDIATAARRYGLKWNQSLISGLESGRKAIGIEEIALLPQLLNEAIGQHAARLRRASGVRQADVELSARTHGLGWKASSVATLEAGKRDLTAAELALLPSILTAALNTPITLADLIPADAQIKLSPTVTTTGATLLGILAATATDGIPPQPEPDTVTVTSTDDTAGRSLVLKGVLPAGDRPRGERARIVAHASREIWGRSLAEERDRIVAEQVGASEDPERVRALRGRVTRGLLDSLAEHLRASA